VISLSRKSVGDDHLFARYVNQLEIELRQVERPLGLSSIEFLCASEVCQIFVIRMNYCSVHRSLNVVTPFGEGTNDGQQFSIVDFVVSFSRGEGFGYE